ncbi:cell division protein ZapE [Candidatus Pelagibacter sp. HIMB1321]|uniref:cell division protein ZapE n=1 Tax=Candidatus Pelagibacter sp. HIMB1321 TaxID=1388755 RepID=UPI000A0800B2|nr:cell division protein ZapE [Candidatus Pelagibacter sp. HIMB1321]SMF78246.1 cell division protein ZapE [Candidatus Pelagibacter sp. HIMB1321]
MKLDKKFIEFCSNKKLEINPNQIEIINTLKNFQNINFDRSFLNSFFKKSSKLGFYLHGDVGVGKTMILDFFFKQLEIKKLKVHFNEFMISFHDFMFENDKKDKAIGIFVKDLKDKAKILFFDEFQVTNIVDAMILGRLFEKIFEKKICVLFSSNIKINDLYKDGLQRDQFLPFLKILKENSIEKELSINEDYRINKKDILNRFLSPINETTNFKLNKFFRELTKNKKNNPKNLNIKGRELLIENFYEGIAKFRFNELCDRNLGAEDYLQISNCCNFILIEGLPDFNEDNSNQQQRFITLIDIIYEKKIPILISSANSLNDLNSSGSLAKIFKRTISRLHELTSIKIQTT